ncbi:MAG: DegT/DnrJ/EryC1/StrS family aminotransferase [Oscillospiraceae bacterium]|nr:DegT/DnrJ/EryC1/StrS family aminotransferase [Oscillospiraceae bacterium]
MINVTRSAMPPFEEYIQTIAPLWESRWLTNMGAIHQKFEAELREFLNSPCVSLYTNGHLALEGVLEALEKKGEIITTPFTFASTTHAITRRGFTPVFCDIEDTYYTMDPAKIEALITDKTVAILPVHVYGNLCDHKAIQEIADRHGLKVIYDAAHAFGVPSAANLGDASMFSFHATKVFHSIEGGCVTCADPELKARMDRLKNFGIAGESIPDIGGNAKMSEFHAAMGLCNLRYVNQWIKARKAVVERYRKNLAGLPGIRLCPEQPGVKSNYAYFPVVFTGPFTRDMATGKLAEQGIIARKYFYPLLNDCAAYGFRGHETPVAKYISERVLTLPLYPELSMADVDRICDILRENLT